MLGPQDLGQRVVVRRIVGTRDDRPLLSDALGELVSLTDHELTIRTGRGPVTVPHHAIVAAKRIPPRPVTRREMAALEQAADEAWPAPVRQRLGEWLLRAADGWTVRGNSALAVGDPGVPLPAAIEAVRHWYAARRLPPRMNVPLPLAARVNTALDDHGWASAPPVLVQTAPLASVVAATPPHPDLPAVHLDRATSPQWLAAAAQRKGAPPAEAAHHLLTAGGQVPVRFASGYEAAGDLLAVGRGSITGGGRWLGLMQLDVVPAARRRGWARHLLGALARWAANSGATDVFLQVEEHNTAAVSLYRSLGFVTHHTYHSRWLPPAE